MIFQHILLFIISFTNLFLAIFVYTRNVKSEINRSFSLFASSMAIWGFGMLSLSLIPAENKPAALSCIPILHLGVVFLPSTFFNFTLAITKDKQRINRLLCYLAYSLSLVFILLGRIGVFSADITYVYGSYRVIGGPADRFFALFFFSFSSYGAYLLFKRYKMTDSFLERNHLRYLLYGIFVAVLGSISNILRVLGVQIYPLAPLGVLLLNIMIAYSIVKYRLMDINVIIRLGVIYGLLTALVTGIWLATIFIFEGFLHFQTLYARILTVIFIIFIFQPIRERIQLMVDKIFSRERHDLQQLLKKVSKDMTTILERKTLLSSILNVIKETIHPEYAVLMLLDKSSRAYIPEFGLGNYNKTIPIGQDAPVIQWFNREKRELLHEEVLENPEFNGVRAEIISFFEGIKTILAIPLFYKDELSGILNLGPKLGDKPYTYDEITFLTTLNNELAIALENTKLFTELRQKVIELEKLTDELKVANAAKSNFLNIVSHELRTPLTVIMGYVGLLSYKVLGDITEAQEKSLKIMLEKCRYLNELIGDMLDLSKIERGKIYELKKQPIDFKKIIEEVILIFTPKAQERQIILQSEIASNFPIVRYDEERAKEIFSKLVDNAIKFSKKGTEGKITIRLEDKGQYLQGSIEDTGIGIKKENFQKIFERFYQLDMSDTRSYEGTGLGLSIVKEILEESGGSIKVESQEGIGSKFIFTLPKEEVREEELPPKLKLKKKIPQETKILIVDDNPEIINIAELYLNLNGYKTTTANDGVEALNKLYAEKPDLVIYSLRLPKVDGYELAHILRDHKETKEIPLIMLVPVEEEENLEKIYQAGATTHLFTPFDFKELMEEIASLV